MSQSYENGQDCGRWPIKMNTDDVDVDFRTREALCSLPKMDRVYLNHHTDGHSQLLCLFKDEQGKFCSRYTQIRAYRPGITERKN